ncbi:hypothetical protein PSTG_12587 [Puccinia striiformis f. sp. tritici PST-78]|uniref:Uncharacterized protein n=1 Tax=Puccinia striiformis f. sp. tritici PST-78 TaxID=1165861 RepID=A0A0L0V473_9BASI|nr:hypothetical protein PSTG_12587 [Puccinia striiformis f. sp. tritici PST-78]
MTPSSAGGPNLHKLTRTHISLEVGDNLISWGRGLQLGPWLIDSVELEFQLPKALDVRETA